MGFVRYGVGEDGVATPKGGDYPANTSEDLVIELDFLVTETPVDMIPCDHGDGEVAMEEFFVTDDDLYGRDNILNHASTPPAAKSLARGDLLGRLQVEVVRGVGSKNLCKSLYGLDSTTLPGILKILEMLPVLDVEILILLSKEIWPDAPADDADPDLLRVELKGYLRDKLYDANYLR